MIDVICCCINEVVANLLAEYQELGPTKFEDKGKFERDISTLHPTVNECLIVKSDLELVLIQISNYISSEANVEIMRKTRVGIKEHQLEINSHHSYIYGGCNHFPYISSCAIVVVNSLVKEVLIEKVFHIVLFVPEEASYGLLATLAFESGGRLKVLELYEGMRPRRIICPMERDKTVANELFYCNALVGGNGDVLETRMQFVQSASWSWRIILKVSSSRVAKRKYNLAGNRGILKVPSLNSRGKE